MSNITPEHQAALCKIKELEETICRFDNLTTIQRRVNQKYIDRSTALHGIIDEIYTGLSWYTPHKAHDQYENDLGFVAARTLESVYLKLMKLK